MRRRNRFVTALAVATCATAAWAQAPAPAPLRFNHPSDLEALSKMEHAIQVAPNVDALMVFVGRHSTLADMMLPGWYDGWEEIYDALALQYAQSASQAKDGATEAPKAAPDITDLKVASDGTLACIAMQIELAHGADKLTFRELDVFEKKADNWYSVSGHAYFPADATTGVAAKPGILPHRRAVAWTDDPIPGPAVWADQAQQELRSWYDARLGETDIDKLMAYYGPTDDTLIYTPYNPSEHRGLKEIRGFYARDMAGVKSIKANISNYRAVTDGAFANVASRQMLTLTMADGTQRTMSRRQSSCLRRVKGRWYSMIEMISFPTDPKTGKAETMVALAETAR